MRGALLVAGTSSDAGKSVLVAGICRWLSREGVRVAPFKAQNMSNNSAVTADGGEIGRAQATQARAAGLEPSTRFNPVLLKPGSDNSSQVIIHGHPVGTLRDYRERDYRDVVLSTLDDLRADFDVVVCEGAGSPAEVNLRDRDIANLGLARAANLPVLVVGDIDRGGVLAHLFGTLAVLDPADQAMIQAFAVNKFRGDRSLLQPGLDWLTETTGRPVLGVLPWREDLWLDAEDSLSYAADGVVGRPLPPHGDQWLRVAAVRLPRISNATDVEALACEPGVSVRFVSEPDRLADADLIVLPGSKSTVDDLEWLRRKGIADAIVSSDTPVLGICGGYQMLGTRIVDHVESGRGEVPGLGLLDLEIEFATEKTLARPTGTAFGHAVSGYEIHHGRVTRQPASPLIQDPLEGAYSNRVIGTHWHGLLDNDDFRRHVLRWTADRTGRTGFTPAPGTSVAQARAAQLDVLGDLVAQHLDTAALEKLATGGPQPLPRLAVTR
ncbi:cobyric acid synthase [Actinophytocola oryzae]|uniref:Cobyric acid synthase n=1 Tax=Actinophytocola oryzae TaxID=502181 RepID=A0A4R7UUM6_9PSEU|nr:cobyric acid synthase [Actinophytocola oryzae]TDV39714.1 adenosylcobyric acid synthase (glutamine-hydrolysing) [Actinophytocola oryzae]